MAPIDGPGLLRLLSFQRQGTADGRRCGFVGLRSSILRSGYNALADAGSAVRSIVLNDLKKIAPTLKIGEFRNRVVMVDDYRLQYIVF